MGFPRGCPAKALRAGQGAQGRDSPSSAAARLGSSFSLGRAPRVCPAPSRELVAGALVSFKQRVDHHAQRSRAPVA